MAKLRRPIQDPVTEDIERPIEGDSGGYPDGQYFTNDDMTNAYFTNDDKSNNYLYADP